MISRLDRLQGRDIYENTVLAKLNELVDAVNVLQEHIKFLDERIKTKNFMIDIEKTNPVSKYIDPYAEQRKWIGKLCRFWDDNYKTTKHFGILTRIDETAIVRYEADNGFWYCACEPVKPYSEIIYNGE